LLPTDAKSDNPRYSARRAIALWLIVSASIWLVIGAFLSSALDRRGNSLDAEAERLSKIAPAAGNSAPKP
jgi:type VI protein secretion system component VasF